MTNFASPSRKVSRRSLVIASIWYLLLAALVLYPLFYRRGYVLLLDWTPTPEVRWRTDGVLGVHGVPVLAVLEALKLVAPTWVIQRLILFGVVWGAGITAHLTAPVRSTPARLFAGTLYAINPFVLVRLLAGHWRLLLAYALVPLAVRAVVRLTKEPSSRRGVAAGVWIAGLAVLSVHALMLLALLAVAGLVGLIFGAGPRRIVRALGAALLIVAAGTLWWIVPAAARGAPARSGVETLEVFASTATEGVPVPLAVAGMRGFWVQRFNQSGPPGWQLLALGLVAIAVLGFLFAIRDHRRPTAATLLGSSVIAWLLAIGVASPLLAATVGATYRWVPGLVAFREPHKLVAVLALSYAWLGAVAVEPLGASRRLTIRTLAVALLAVPFVYTPGIFGGLSGRMRPVEYPGSWTTADRFFLRDPDRFSVLSLPWKLYLPLPFNHPTEPVANPARDFFSVPVVASDNPEIGDGLQVPDDPVSRRVNRLILNYQTVEDFGSQIAPLRIKYVMLVPNTRVGDYQFLYEQEDLEVVFRSRDLVVFLNTAWAEDQH